MFKEFRDFIKRGNVLDLAVAVVIGAAFGKIVTSLVEGVIMPPIGLLLRRVDFSELFIDLSGKGYTSFASAKDAGAPIIAYGIFVNNVINFLIIAFVVFLIIKWINRRKEEKAADTHDCPFCLSKIPIKATRCPACTSQLSAAVEP